MLTKKRTIWMVIAIITAVLILTPSLHYLPPTHPVSLFSYLYSTAVLIWVIGWCVQFEKEKQILHRVIDRCGLLRLKTAQFIVVIVTAVIFQCFTMKNLQPNSILSMISDTYSLFALVLFIMRIRDWVRALHNWLQMRFQNYRVFYEQIAESQKQKSRITRVLYVTLRILTMVCAVAMLLTGEYQNFFLSLLTLVLFTLPDVLQRNFAVHLPTGLETIIYCFIFAAEVLGEINNFYGLIPGWDTILHTINGFLCAAIGFSLVDMLNRRSENISLSPIYVAITAFCFSMTVGVLWEFIEFFGDAFFFVDMQKDTIVQSIKSIAINPTGANVPVLLSGITQIDIAMTGGEHFIIQGGYLDIGIADTMKDLFVNLIGAVVFSTFGYFYIKERDRNTFVTKFIPVVEKQKIQDKEETETQLQEVEA